MTRTRVKGEHKAPSVPFEKQDFETRRIAALGAVVDAALDETANRVLDIVTSATQGTEIYQAHDIEILTAAREAGVKVVHRLQADLASLRLATLIANGAESKLQALGAWLNRDARPDLPDGLREIALCGMVLHAKTIKKQRAHAEKTACSADVLHAFTQDLAHLDDLSNVVKGQLTFDWAAAVGSEEEDET